MIIIMKTSASADEVAAVVAEVQRHSFRAQVSRGDERTLIGCAGPVDADRAALSDHFAIRPGVEEVKLISKPYKYAAREWRPEPTRVRLNGVEVGGQQLVIIAGPCAVESPEQLFATAEVIKRFGGTALRGGVFKPRTSPLAFQGLGGQGIPLLRQARQRFGLSIVSEVMDLGNVWELMEAVDVFQVGSRNMQNYPLLTELGRQHHRPILLKRGFGASIDELLQAADYLLAEQHPGVMLCLRGVVPLHGSHLRYQPDLGDLPLLKQLTHLPVLFDPSHAAGRADLVIPLSCMAVAGGADGLLVEVHPDPTRARSDPKQQLTFDQFAALMSALRRCAADFDRTI